LIIQDLEFNYLHVRVFKIDYMYEVFMILMDKFFLSVVFHPSF